PAPRAPGRPAVLVPPAPGEAVGASWVVSAALATGVLACYLGFAPPVSGDKDASELTLALATGGVIHPTGYPLYTILGYAFVGILHRLGASFPFAANAWAALGGSVAMFFYHRLALRLVPARRGGSRVTAPGCSWPVPSRWPSAWHSCAPAASRRGPLGPGWWAGCSRSSVGATSARGRFIPTARSGRCSGRRSRARSIT